MDIILMLMFQGVKFISADSMVVIHAKTPNNTLTFSSWGFVFYDEINRFMFYTKKKSIWTSRIICECVYCILPEPVWIIQIQVFRS